MRAEAFALDGNTPGTETVSSHSARDPRTDPQPGDVLAIDGDVREVLQCWHGRIEYGFPGKAATRSMPRVLWDVWARNAEVRRVAP